VGHWASKWVRISGYGDQRSELTPIGITVAIWNGDLLTNHFSWPSEILVAQLVGELFFQAQVDELGDLRSRGPRSFCGC
jgi:hypothetical protein